ncbi:hypothetical protein KHA80_23040 [Anaerobacillus sp. HL2]|nr:hypothetical protein KHA80_23040 [Anaerobacillus sp. HL2]
MEASDTRTEARHILKTGAMYCCYKSTVRLHEEVLKLDLRRINGRDKVDAGNIHELCIWLDAVLKRYITAVVLELKSQTKFNVYTII